MERLKSYQFALVNLNEPGYNTTVDDISCVHSVPGQGLCDECRVDYEADQSAWLEFGEHEAGIARWNAIHDEMQAELRREPYQGYTDDDIPF